MKRSVLVFARRSGSAATLAAALVACASSTYGSAVSWGPSQSTRLTAVDAGEVVRVHIESRQGPIRFEGNDSSSVLVALRVGHARGRVGTRHCPVASTPPRIETSVVQGELRVRTERMDESCVAEWVVSMPRGLVAEARVGTGDITVEGVAGGVSVTIGVGEVRVRAPGGRVQVDAEVGDVEVDYASDSYGSLSARTSVGGIALWIGDRRLEHRGAPGAGDALQLAGGAGDPIRVATGVGDIVIRVGARR